MNRRLPSKQGELRTFLLDHESFEIESAGEQVGNSAELVEAYAIP